LQTPLKVYLIYETEGTEKVRSTSNTPLKIKKK
jgi:hypothetical protein